MQLPKQLVVQGIVARNIHLDVHSAEKGTGVIKPKYKLAGNRFPTGGILFWVHTSKPVDAEERTIKLEHPQHYDECNSNALKTAPSYVCISKTDYLTDDEIFSKYSNSANGFKKVAVVKEETFKCLVAMRSKLRLSANPNSLKLITAIATATVGSDENIDDVLKSMGLS